MSRVPVKILVIDDEPDIRRSLVSVLERDGYECVSAGSGEEGLELSRSGPFDIVICDIRMPGIDGVEVMRRVRAESPETIVLLITAYASLDTAIEAVREGAGDYLTKPIRFEALLLRIGNLLRVRELERENRTLRIERRSRGAANEIVGESAAIGEIRELVKRVGAAPGNVLIEGESGSGKELVARAVHLASDRRRGPFLPVNCGALPENLVESEFFGYAKGAFTGADRDKDGLFQEARRGTLFLDEVSEIPLPLQAKVLRAIESKEVRPVGSPRAVGADVRIVAATNRNLEETVGRGGFRQDLFFRLNVLRIPVPPLRDRIEDIPPLALHFLERFRGEYRSPVIRISPEAILLLQRYSWKGNVRELQNVIQRALITADRPVLEAELFERILGEKGPSDLNLKKALRRYEGAHIARVLRENGGDKRRTAEALGISLASLYDKLKT